MRKILVLNSKGGCGKTTIVTNLASYYAVWGVKTALVDYDPQLSSTEWLQARPDWADPIHGICAVSERVHYPGGTERVVIDSPARVGRRDVANLARRADVVLIPILPSPIDIRAAAHFVGELLLSGSIAHHAQLGLVANRVREQTLIYGKLEQFLAGLKRDIPFVTHLRDTQNYIRAAEQGIGIFEMAPYAVAPDLEQWRPLINWIEKNK